MTRRPGICLGMLAALAVSLVLAPAAHGWTGPPTRTPDAGVAHPYGVPTTHTCATPGRLGCYYASVAGWCPKALSPESPVVTTAEDGRLAQPWQAPLVEYDGTLHNNPVTTAELALGDYTRYWSTGDARFLVFFLDAADWLRAQQQADGSWRYDFAFQDLSPDWSSGMAQGLAISVLCRAYAQTGVIGYLRAARRSFAFMERAVAQGGDLGALPDGVPMLEEYPGSVVFAHVLNGSVFALWGVRDLYLTTGDPATLALWRRLSVALPRILKLYDTGNWCRYDPTATRPIELWYMQIHVAQMFVMGAITGDGRYTQYAASWLGYLAHGAPSSSAGARAAQPPLGLDEPSPTGRPESGAPRRSRYYGRSRQTRR